MHLLNRLTEGKGRVGEGLKMAFWLLCFHSLWLPPEKREKADPVKPVSLSSSLSLPPSPLSMPHIMLKFQQRVWGGARGHLRKERVNPTEKRPPCVARTGALVSHSDTEPWDVKAAP